jgi:photosystem II stability/assembly factor-like uncharacterized protein
MKALKYISLIGSLMILGIGCFFMTVRNTAADVRTLVPSVAKTETFALPSPTYTSGMIQFTNLPSNPDDCWQCEQEEKTWVKVDALYAIDITDVFIGGHTLFPGAANRSFLLRSTDQGLHWTEVMSTTTRSGVTRIAFIGEGEGWALVEGVGDAGEAMPVTIWHSSDYGVTWQMLGNVLYNENKGESIFCYINGMKFYNSRYGEIKIVCRDPGPHDYFAILSTSDGGITWQRSYSIPLPSQLPGDPGDKRFLSAFADLEGGRFGSHGGRCEFMGDDEICKAFGQDGSEWETKYFGANRGELLIRHRLPVESEWTTYALPACFEFRQGKIIGLCEQPSP